MVKKRLKSNKTVNKKKLEIVNIYFGYIVLQIYYKYDKKILNKFSLSHKI